MKNNYVRWPVFIWTIGIIMASVTGIFTVLGNQRLVVSELNVELRERTARIESDVSWIKRNMTVFSNDISDVPD